MLVSMLEVTNNAPIAYNRPIGGDRKRAPDHEKEAHPVLHRKAASFLATLALTAGSVTWAAIAASSASACVEDTDGDCYVSSYGYWNVQNTDSQGLAEHASPDINSAITGWLRNGTPIEVVCQVNGTTDPYDGLPYTVWDRLDNGYWVYDGIFVSSPGDGYHIVLNHC